MNTTDLLTASRTSSRAGSARGDGAALALSKPLVSVVVPAFNEAAIVEKNLAALCQYMASLEDEYRWEIVVVNDGSSRSEEHTSELQSRTLISYAVFCLKK